MAVKRRTIGRHGGVNIVEFCWNAAPRRDLLGKPSRVPLCHSAAIDQRSAWNNIGLCEGLFSVGFTVLLGGVKRVYWHCAEVLLYLLTMRCGVSQATQTQRPMSKDLRKKLKEKNLWFGFLSLQNEWHSEEWKRENKVAHRKWWRWNNNNIPMKVITIQFSVDISCSQFVLALQEMKLCMQFVIDEVSKEHPGLSVAAALKRVRWDCTEIFRIFLWLELELK